MIKECAMPYELLVERIGDMEITNLKTLFAKMVVNTGS